MASKGRYSKAPQWWKHLRKYKRAFWKSERRGAKREAKEQSNGNM
jgi:hypothetical protein